MTAYYASGEYVIWDRMGWLARARDWRMLDLRVRVAPVHPSTSSHSVSPPTLGWNALCFCTPPRPRPPAPSSHALVAHALLAHALLLRTHSKILAAATVSQHILQTECISPLVHISTRGCKTECISRLVEYRR